MKNCRLHIKCIISGFIVLALGAVSYMSIGNIIEAYQKGSIEYGRDIKAALDIQSYVKRAESHLALYLLVHDQIDLEKYHSRLATVTSNIEELKDLVDTPKKKKTILMMEEALGRLKRSGDELLELHDNHEDTLLISPERHYLLNDFNNSVEIVRSLAVELSQNHVIGLAVQISSDAKMIETALILRYFQTSLESDKELVYDYIDKVDHALKSLQSEIYANQIETYTQVQTIEIGMKEAKKLVNELIIEFEASSNGFSPEKNKQKLVEFHDACSDIRRAGISLATDEIFYANKFIDIAHEKAQRGQTIILLSFVLALLMLVMIHTNIFGSFNCDNHKNKSA